MFKYIYNYCKSIYFIYNIYYDKLNIEKHNKFLRTIKGCGCIPIKFIQWMLPVLYLLCDKKYYNILNIYKETYEECYFHSIEHTLKIYENNFNKKLYDDYLTIDCLKSGSIGQVYKITDNNNNKYAMKVIHPYIRYEIFIIRHIIYYLTCFMNIRLIDINKFFEIFTKQTDFLNEGNNILQFYEKYKDNDKIIIPQLIKVSNDIIIMEYLEYEEIKINDFIIVC